MGRRAGVDAGPIGCQIFRESFQLEPVLVDEPAFDSHMIAARRDIHGPLPPMISSTVARKSTAADILDDHQPRQLIRRGQCQYNSAQTA
jgi:hypothetical protein